MNSSDAPSYGLWGLVILNSVVFIAFAFSFFKPQTKTDWRSFSAFSAFIIALFVEMYGFPLSIYVLSGWLSPKYPGINFLTHDNGHLIHTLLGMKGNPHWDIFHILSNGFIFGGFISLSSAWHTLWQAQQQHRLANTGLYAYLRHPQYMAFIAIMLGFLLQWPTLPTLVMFPVLTLMYVRLGIQEEATMAAEFGEQYRRWAAVTPRFFPRLSLPNTALNNPRRP